MLELRSPVALCAVFNCLVRVSGCSLFVELTHSSRLLKTISRYRPTERFPVVTLPLPRNNMLLFDAVGEYRVVWSAADSTLTPQTGTDCSSFDHACRQRMRHFCVYGFIRRPLQAIPYIECAVLNLSPRSRDRF